MLEFVKGKKKVEKEKERWGFKYYRERRPGALIRVNSAREFRV